MTAITIRRSPSRTLTLVEPFEPVDLGIERFDDDVWGSWTSTHLHPALDIYEEKDELVIKAELSGVRKEDIDVSVEDGCLNIRAEKKPEEISKEATYYSSERCFGEYFRSVELPFPVDAGKTSATFENGLLEIRLPKAEEAKSKHIEVKVK